MLLGKGKVSHLGLLNCQKEQENVTFPSMWVSASGEDKGIVPLKREASLSIERADNG